MLAGRCARARAAEGEPEHERLALRGGGGGKGAAAGGDGRGPAPWLPAPAARAPRVTDTSGPRLWRPRRVRRIAWPPRRPPSSSALRHRARGQGPGSWHDDNKRALLDPTTKVARGVPSVRPLGSYIGLVAVL
ncbi:hypothetical protein PVAP13_9NG518614 [Panicum virgatum]|uniref:Uncharacterized protein n=1 Tax=Panicum virgatum TaxID=38727 RepID=A0A8T0MSN1_PANVG|nr:hypothetical protein PVAP13_9NG518614 [Panicum virgatum]KAG2540035.1 hypothetical protein PVAP13_9NG518614 [Panicum virgatum]